MAILDTIVSIQLTQQTAANQPASTTVPLIVGSTSATGWAAGDVVHAYTSPAAMLTDGFTTTSAEYRAALLFAAAQSGSNQFLVGNIPTGTATLDGLSAIQAENNSWYGLIFAQPTDEIITTVAPWIEAQDKILVASTDDTDVADGSNTSNLLTQLVAQGYDRVAILPSPANRAAGTCIEAGWAGACLPAVPGTLTWGFKVIPGATPDKWTDAQVSTLIGNPAADIAGRNANIYVQLAGTQQPLVYPGTMVSGMRIDTRVGIDWLKFNMQTAIFNLLTGLPKVPYTDKGVGVLISTVRSVIDTAVANTLVDDGRAITVDAASITTVPPSQRQARLAPTITFSCYLQGAIEAVQVKGTIEV